ncbi:MAG: pyruvate carboxylase subunit B [Oscillospiraceae bacterium]|nr:pyruvate carboxylase subunit B [Oscillospiraceae bacterium]
MQKQKVNFTETILRDANQSLIATRMPFDKFEPILDKIDQAGYYSIECWGGATFDSCLRYLDEDPWERLRKIKARMKNTKLQMLLRGQNLLGYKHYPDDVVRRFVRRSVENGIDIIRIFDALNDLRNLEVSIDETLKAGAHASGAISYTTSPVHTLAKYAEICKSLQGMGVQSICIKDMAGVMSPAEAYDLVSAIKDSVDLPVVLHTHCTTGLAYMTILKAVEAGADVIDTAISCFSGGTSQPATETLAYALDQLGYPVDVKPAVLKEINDYFKPYRDECLKSGLLEPTVMGTSTDALNYKIPGGMLSNLVAQLKAQNALDKLDAVLEETPRVREDMGYPPLVTPLSQMVGVQAVTNVLLGERYKMIGKEIKAYLRGEYGAAPGEINPDVLEKGLAGDTRITERYAATLAPQLESAKEEIGDLARNEDDVLSYIAFPQQAEAFLKARKAEAENKAKYTIECID